MYDPNAPLPEPVNPPNPRSLADQAPAADRPRTGDISAEARLDAHTTDGTRSFSLCLFATTHQPGKIRVKIGDAPAIWVDRFDLSEALDALNLPDHGGFGR